MQRPAQACTSQGTIIHVSTSRWTWFWLFRISPSFTSGSANPDDIKCNLTTRRCFTAAYLDGN